MVFHLGVLEGLRQSGLIEPTSAGRVVGTSAGALVAASLVDGVSTRAFLDALAASAPSGLLREIQNARTSGADLPSETHLTPGVAQVSSGSRAPIVRVAGVVPGIMPTNAMGRLPIAVSETWDERLWITAVRVRDGATIVFGRDLHGMTPGMAIEASCAVPLMFQPKEIGNERYVDGAVASTTHADLLSDDGHDLVVVSAPMTRSGGGLRRATARRQVRAEVDRLKQGRCRVLVLAPNAEVVREARGYPMRHREARWAIVEAATRQTVQAVRQMPAP